MRFQVGYLMVLHRREQPLAKVVVVDTFLRPEDSACQNEYDLLPYEQKQECVRSLYLSVQVL